MGQILSPETFVFGHHDITVNLRLTGKSKTGFFVVRREVEPPPLSAGLVVARSFDTNGACPARAKSLAIEPTRVSIMRRQLRTKQRIAYRFTLLTRNLQALKFNFIHSSSTAHGPSLRCEYRLRGSITLLALHKTDITHRHCGRKPAWRCP